MRRIRRFICRVLGHKMEQASGTVQWREAGTLTFHTWSEPVGRCQRCNWLDGISVWLEGIHSATPIKISGYGVVVTNCTYTPEEAV